MGQPSKTANHGVVLTVGGLCGVDRAAIVIPLFTDSTTVTATSLCDDALVSFRTSCLTALLNIMAGDSQITYIQGEAMVDGFVPAREDYPLASHVGLRGAPSMPAQVTALSVYYLDPLDFVQSTPPAPKKKTAVGKTNFFGVSVGDVTGDIVSSGLVTAMETFDALMLTGFNSIGSSGKWYRAVAAAKPRDPATVIRRCIQAVARDYVATQRRRLVPRN